MRSTNQRCNGGTALYTVLFASPDPQQGFGGQAEPRPGSYDQHGGLESMAHDLVHDQVGGNMGLPSTAARDPLFFTCEH